MNEPLWQATFLSLRVALAATALAAGIAVPLAFCFTRWRVPGQVLIETLLTVPLVLPPTVVGFLILIVAGSRGPLALALRRFLDQHYSIAFTFHGAVVASAVVALPLIYLPVRTAFAHVEREMEDVARLFGANLLQVFWHVSLPMARRGLAGGLMLAFARALGEFGATVMVYGDLPGRQTLPIFIYTDYVSGDMSHATPAVLVLTGVAMLVILIYNRSSLARQD